MKHDVWQTSVKLVSPEFRDIMTKSGPKNGRVAPEKSATPENGVITIKENVKNKWGNEMSRYLKTPYVEINSGLFSAQGK